MQLAKTQELVGHVGPVRLLLISSAENLLVSAGEDFSIRTWDTVAWQTQAVIREMDAGVHQSLLIGDISSCGEYLATGGEDKKVFVWRIGDWAQVGSYPEHKDFVFDIAISSDGKTAATWDMTRTLHFWHIKSPSCIGTLADLWGKGQFIGDRYLLFGGLGEKTLLIDASTASIVQELPKATAIAVAQSGQWVALAESDSVTIWQIH